MYINTRMRHCFGLFIRPALLALALGAGNISAESTVTFDVGESYALPGEQNVPVMFYIATSRDTVMGFEAWLQIEGAVVSFDLGFDTAGMACSGWEISIRDLTGIGRDILLRASTSKSGLAIRPEDGIVQPIVLYADIGPLPDSMTHRRMMILPAFQVTSGSGHIADTLCYRCLQWFDSTCINWIAVTDPPCDWTEIHFTDTSATEYIAEDGWVELLQMSICGDLNGSSTVDISDLVYYVEFLFGAGPPPFNMQTADGNNDGVVDIADLTRFVDFLFGNGPPLNCSSAK